MYSTQVVENTNVLVLRPPHLQISACLSLIVENVLPFYVTVHKCLKKNVLLQRVGIVSGQLLSLVAFEQVDLKQTLWDSAHYTLPCAVLDKTFLDTHIVLGFDIRFCLVKNF